MAYKIMDDIEMKLRFWVLIAALISLPCHGMDFNELKAQIQQHNPSSSISNLSAAEDFPYFAVKNIALSSPTKGTIILIHGEGEHADWPDVIHPLRVSLPRFGWTTVSLQFPELDKSIEANEQIQRLERYFSQLAAVIQKEQYNNLVFITRGKHAQVIANSLPTSLSNQIKAYVTISPTENEVANQQPLSQSLARFNAAILDIYAQRDYPMVTQMAKLRLANMKQHIQTLPADTQFKYQQVVIPATDHSFSGQETTLVKRIAGWLKRSIKAR